MSIPISTKRNITFPNCFIYPGLIPLSTTINNFTLESLLTAPLDKFKADRVKDPEAGIPLKKAHPIFATPDPKISLLSLGRSPVRDAIDLVTTEISSVTKKANPNATPESSEILISLDFPAWAI